MLLFCAFFFKHFICDFPLQIYVMFTNKGRYGHPGGLVHAATHGVGTLLLLACFGFGWISFAYAAIDAATHYHIDWSKTNLNDYFKLGTSDPAFWWLLGLDQFLHYLTYAWIIACVI